MEQLAVLHQAIVNALATPGEGCLRAAAALCDELPPAGEDEAGLAADCLYQVGFAGETAGEQQLAESFYLRALAYEPPPWVAANLHYRAALCMQRQGRTDPAIEQHFRRAIERAEHSPDVRQLARFALGCLLLEAGDAAGAAGHFYILCELEPPGSIPRLDLLARRLLSVLRSESGDPAGTAHRVIAELPAITADTDAALLQLFFAAAQEALDQTLYELAEEIYRHLLVCDSMAASIRANALFRLGVALEFRNQWMGSIASYRAAIALGSAWPEVGRLARYHLAHLLTCAEDYEEAAAIYAELCRDAPDGLLAELQFKQAVCMFHCGDTQTAERLARSIEGVSGAQRAQIDQLLADIYESRREYRPAASCYERIIQNPFTEVTVKIAALQRMSAIQKSL